MARRARSRGISLAPIPCALGAALACLTAGLLFAQGAGARYLGGTLGGGPQITQFKCDGAPRGTLAATSESALVFDGGAKARITVDYGQISAVLFGVETAARAGFCYPWDSYVQFTKKRHYLLTLMFRDGRGDEQAAVFELDKAAVRSTLAAIELHAGKQVEFTDAFACIEHKTADECGHGQPGELNGLTKVFIDTRDTSARDRIWSELEAPQLGLALMNEIQGAEIVLKYRGATVVETGSQFVANGGRPMDAGRGEVHVVREGRSRVVILFEAVKSSPLQKHPATNFAKTFVEAYRRSRSLP
jgi:hypothetical protein